DGRGSHVRDEISDRRGFPVAEQEDLENSAEYGAEQDRAEFAGSLRSGVAGGDIGSHRDPPPRSAHVQKVLYGHVVGLTPFEIAEELGPGNECNQHLKRAATEGSGGCRCYFRLFQSFQSALTDSAITSAAECSQPDFRRLRSVPSSRASK